MMKFRTVKTQIINILSAAESGRYVTIGSKKQSKGASENVDLPRVVAFYRSGDFPKSSSNFESIKQHDAEYILEFTVIEYTTTDLSVIDNDASTPTQIAAALANSEQASDRADSAMDQLFDNVYQVIMDARNYDLGLPVGDVVDRYIDGFQKGDPLKKGQYVALSAQCRLTCRVSEEVTGEIGTPINSNDTTVNLNEDQGDNMGVITG